MKKLLSCFLLLVLSVNCTSRTIYKKPNDLIPKDTMGMLIKELLLANAAKNVRNKQNKTKVNYHPLVYEKYQIDSLRFQASNLYYTSKIDEYEDILEDVIKDYNEERAVLVAIQKKRDSIIKDSIKKIEEKKAKEIKAQEKTKKRKGPAKLKKKRQS